MEIRYTDRAKNDIAFWKKTGNKKIQKKITELLESIGQTPFEGIGKPELLKYQLSGAWSRRIDHEHRIIYDVQDDAVEILSLRGHYLK